MDWQSYKTEDIITGKNPDDVSLLKLFLIDYSKLTGITDLCASCHSEIRKYHKDWISQKSDKMAKSAYILKAKYNGIQLEFGSSVHVTNDNMTDAYGKKLLKEKGAHLFDAVPEAKAKQPKKAVKDEVQD